MREESMNRRTIFRDNQELHTLKLIPRIKEAIQDEQDQFANSVNKTSTTSSKMIGDNDTFHL